MAPSRGHKVLVVAGSTQLAAFSVGGAVCYPAVLLHQLRAKDSVIQLDLDTASWIVLIILFQGSLHGLAGIPSILMPAIMQWRGRKFAFMVACIIIIIGWLLTYTAASVSVMLIGETFHGLGTNSILAASLLSMSEMITPKYRNMALLSYISLQSLGMAVVGILTHYLHWKTICIIMCMPVFMALIMAFMWPESPYWLACKGEFDKCERAFERLRGIDEQSKLELAQLINAQKQIIHSNRQSSNSVTWKSLCKTLTSRDFYIPSLHMFVLLNLMYWSGFIVFLIYATEITEKATLSENAAFTGGIIINCVLFVGFTATGIMIKYFDNKPVLLWSVLGTSVALLCSFVVSCLQETGLLQKDSMLCLYCLIAYMMCTCLGMSSIIFPIASELMPVKHRGIGGALLVIFACALHTTSVKAAPYLFLYINLSGTFLVYTLNAIICGLFIWKYVPETKGRTLQDIEYFYMYGKFVVNRIDKDCVGIIRSPKHNM